MTKTYSQPIFKITAVALAIALAGCATDTPVSSDTDDTLEKTSAPRALELTAQPITPSSNWKMIWNDEFDGDDIDMSKWSFEENCWGGGNNEQQCYT
ncbi:MAG: glycoside hydrolase family 16 protein, partial [Psychromonas sp.]